MEQHCVETFLIQESEREGVSLNKRYIKAREYMMMSKLMGLCVTGEGHQLQEYEGIWGLEKIKIIFYI